MRYKADFGTYDSATNRMPVTHNGTLLGYVRANAWGWSYYPVGHTKGGTLYRTIDEVKRSLPRVESRMARCGDG